MTEKWEKWRYRKVYLMALKGDSVSKDLLFERHRKSIDVIPSYCLAYIYQFLDWDESRYRQVFLMAQKGDSRSRVFLLEKYRTSRDAMPGYCLDYINHFLENIEDDLRSNDKRTSTKFFPDNPKKGTDISKKLAVFRYYNYLIDSGVSSKNAISSIANEWGYTTNNSNDAASAIYRVIRDAKSFLHELEVKASESDTESAALSARTLEIMSLHAELIKLGESYKESPPARGSEAYKEHFNEFQSFIEKLVSLGASPYSNR
jgi:hypothetical protein